MPIYHPEVEASEHEVASQAKRVMLYGWDALNLQAVKLNVDESGAIKTEYWATNHIRESGSITYIGKEKEDGTWLINKIDETTPTDFGWAGMGNNPSVTSYTTAFTNRESLTYGIYSEAL